MPDEPNGNTPVATEPAPTDTTTAPDTDALQKQVTELNSALEQHRTDSQAEIAKRDTLLQQYQVALGNLTKQQAQAPPPKKEEPTTDPYEPGTKEYITGIVQKEAQRIVDEKAAQMVTNADIQTRLGDDKQVLEEAQREYAALKQNPAFSNLPDYAIQAMAVDRAKSAVFESKSTQLQAELSKSKGENMEDGNTTSLPSTSPAGHQAKPLDPNDPDADLKAWEAEPKNVTWFRKWTEMPHIDPTSKEVIRFLGQEQPANELYRKFAIRSVRTGFNLGGASAMAVRDWQGVLGGRQ